MVDLFIIAFLAVTAAFAVYSLRSKKNAGGCAGGCSGCSHAGSCSAFHDPRSADREVGQLAAGGGEQVAGREFHL